MRLQTQNDLCANTVALDYQTMLDVAKSAYAYALEAVYKGQNRLNAFPYEEGNSMRKILAESLVDDAVRLSKAANMLSTLEDGLDREEVKVVNHPQTGEHLGDILRMPQVKKEK